VAFFNAGNQAVTFKVAGKNASSTGYSLAFDYVDLVQTESRETESLAIVSKSAGVPAGMFTASGASGGAGTFFNATSVGQSVAYNVPVPKYGSYDVYVGVQTKPNKGVFRLAIDGVEQGYDDGGSPVYAWNEYAVTAGYEEVFVGNVFSDNMGNHAFTFTVAGRNPNSSGYTLAFDYVRLQEVSW
jgi:hypothetical protein